MKKPRSGAGPRAGLHIVSILVEEMLALTLAPLREEGRVGSGQSSWSGDLVHKKPCR